MSELEVDPAAEASLDASPAPVLRPAHAEGDLERLIEHLVKTLGDPFEQELEELRGISIE
jgi:hypothetical protein